MIKPGTENAAGFPFSSGYVGGGYDMGFGKGYGMGSQGRSNRNYSSRSTGFDPSNGRSNIGTGNVSADAEFYQGRRRSYRNESYSGNPSAGMRRASTGEAGRGAGHGPGAGFSTRTAYGSVCGGGRGYGSTTVVGNCPHGGYESSGFAPFGDARWCSSAAEGNPASVGVGAAGGVCYSRPAGGPAAVCYSGSLGTPAGVCYAVPAGTSAGVQYAGPIGSSGGLCYPTAVRLF